jgi:hypothetical protein
MGVTGRPCVKVSLIIDFSLYRITIYTDLDVRLAVASCPLLIYFQLPVLVLPSP